MSGQQVVRRLKPEEEELARKRVELAAIRATLADRELELADFRRQLAGFEGRYLRQVGTLYAELDEWKARLSELRAKYAPTPETKQQARQTWQDSHGDSAKTRDFSPSPELKNLYREVAKRIHPDFATDAADRERRTRLMAEANRAYESGDADALRRILDEFQDGADAVVGEGIGAELIRIIRQIDEARERIAGIKQELANLPQSEIAKLARDEESARQNGRDLLAELAASVQEQIRLAKHEYELFVAEVQNL
jgi:predicted  nucleic acid-binding Zn-ribbon protein